MRHRRHGRVLGRSPSHRRALLRNLASALIITERLESEFDVNPPKVKGRIITTVAKAKEVRPMVEKCVTIAKKGLIAQRAAADFGTAAERNTAEWKQWRQSENYAKWVEASAPAVTARRRLLQMLCNKEAVGILFDVLAERFEDRPGGYTRILRLATPRLGDAGPRAILEFVGNNDRVVKRSEKPDFGSEDEGESVDSTDKAGADAEASAPQDENNEVKNSDE
jgi:large subunit ribosomal protein L17